VAEVLPAVEIGPEGAASGAVIWLHGLGADGYDFAPIVPLLALPAVRFVLPHAPRMPVTINLGWEMPAWYDLRSLDEGPGREDVDGLVASAGRLGALIEREEARGVPASRIVLAGFSQGGAVVLHLAPRFPRTLAGILALSTYVVAPERLGVEEADANRATPALFCHGRGDDVVPIHRGRGAFALFAAGRPARMLEFDMGHEVCPEEIGAIRDWLHARLGPARWGSRDAW
jgi:phospholipase/carboxylesterase